MPEYYLDIETTGLDPMRHQIITIAYQRLSMVSGRVEGDLNILKIWDSTEREMLELFLPILTGSGPFSFVAIGPNIPFVYSFIVARAVTHHLDAPDPLHLFGSKPYLDLKPLLVMMNRGSFKGASLERFVPMKVSGETVPQLYRDLRYNEVLDHVREKSMGFCGLYKHLKERIPDLAHGI